MGLHFYFHLSFDFHLNESLSLAGLGPRGDAATCEGRWAAAPIDKHDMKTNQNVNKDDAFELLGLILIEKYVTNLRSHLVEEYVDGLLMGW